MTFTQEQMDAWASEVGLVPSHSGWIVSLLRDVETKLVLLSDDGRARWRARQEADTATLGTPYYLPDAKLEKVRARLKLGETTAFGKHLVASDARFDSELLASIADKAYLPVRGSL